MRRIILLIAAALIFVTGCQSQKALYQEGAGAAKGLINQDDALADEAVEPLPADTAATATGIEEGMPEAGGRIKSLDDLYSDYHSLKIKKKGDNTVYDAVKPLEYVFADMLSKVWAMDTSTPEGAKRAKEFDDGYYDYRLIFEGAEDILFTLEGNVLHFEGEEQRYILWGNSKALWDSLVFDAGDNSAAIPEERIRVMVNTCKEDLDGDGKDENIELAYERGKNGSLNGDLTLYINGAAASIMKDEGWATKPYPSIGEMPGICFQQEQGGKSKAVLVIYSWATNKIGSTGVINAYRYSDGHIAEVKLKEAEHIIKYKGDDMASVSFPSLRRTANVKIDPMTLGMLSNGKASPRQELEAKDTFYPHPLWYIVKDYNGDGQAELCGHYLLRWPPFSLCSLYIYYKYENGELEPVQVFTPFLYGDDERRIYLKSSIFDLIGFKGYLAAGDRGIADESFMPAYDYTPDEIKDVLKELQKDKILKAEGDRLYINF